jgi:diguanylate cyclase (GGDEF)-like protein/PAS domain S-box-containing protein
MTDSPTWSDGSRVGAAQSGSHTTQSAPFASVTSSSAPRVLAPWVYLGINVPLIIAIFSVPHYHVYLWGSMGVGAAVAIVVGVIRNRPTRPAAWIVVALGVATFASGDISYDVLTDFLHERNPYPSVADVFYLATYLLLAAGLIMMVRSRRRRDSDTGAALDALIITTGLGALSWIYLIQPYAYATDLGMLSKLTSIAYPLGDILLLGVLLRLVFGGGTRNPSVRLLVAGAVGLFGADCIYGWIQLHGSWRVGGPTDLGWVLFYVCWGAAALHPGMRDLTIERPWRARHLSLSTMAVLCVSALIAPLALVVRQAAGFRDDGIILSTVSAVGFILVILRLIGLVRAQGVDARREQALREFSEYLVTASDRSAVWNAGVDAIVNIHASGVIGCVVTASESNRAEIVAATWPEFVGAKVKVSQPDQRSDLRTLALVGGLTIGGTPASTIWTQLRSPEGRRTQERILLAHDRPLPIDLRAILDGVASQLFLALERVESARKVDTARNERRFQAMVQYSTDMITLLGPDLRVFYQSPAVKEILGREPEEILGLPLEDLVHPDEVETAEAQIAKVLGGGLGSTSTYEFRIAHHDGQWRTLNVVITNLLDESDVGAIVLNSRDMTTRHALEQELNHQAFHDTLTGLANRSLFFDRLSHAMDQDGREKNPVAVLFLDLDDFKAVNDSFGHPAGDDLLVEVARRIRSATRPSDTVARFGGDEFAVLVESGAMPQAAQAVAEGIIEALNPSFRLEANDFVVRASIGIAIARRPQETPDDLLRDADLAMYVAKRNGKGHFEMYRPKMHEDALRLVETEVGIREGLEAGEFEVFYQPIVNAHTGQLTAAEALVRWHHPSRGILTPLEFIGVAEDTGLIIPLGAYVLNAATRQVQAWKISGVVDEAFYVSVNLSTFQLRESDLVDSVARALDDSGLPPQALVLEVTESGLIESLTVTVPRLLALRTLGVRLAIDDFGTGYSSLSYLSDLPVNFVKIDKSFVDRIMSGSEGSAVVRGIIDLSRAMGFTCIAEGVEREEQRRVLDDLGCAYLQGYLFGRPANGVDAARGFKNLRPGRSSILLGRP